MPGLLIKDLPKDLHQRLRSRAAGTQRSLSREALLILQEALDDRVTRPTIEEVDRLRQTGRRPLNDQVLARARRHGRS